jgi:hypothetical protein
MTASRDNDDKRNPDLIKVYDQLCESYRAIDDFRAKLLGFIPLVTGAGISFLFEKIPNLQDISVETKSLLSAVGVFGILITLGLFSYELFGIKKCAALIKAGQKLEFSMHIKNGQFRKRPQNIAHVINEPFAAGVIYPTVLSAWTFFTLAFIWPKANPLIPIVLLVGGFVATLLYESILRKTYWGNKKDHIDTTQQKRKVRRIQGA